MKDRKGATQECLGGVLINPDMLSPQKPLHLPDITAGIEPILKEPLKQIPLVREPITKVPLNKTE